MKTYTLHVRFSGGWKLIGEVNTTSRREAWMECIRKFPEVTHVEDMNVELTRILWRKAVHITFNLAGKLTVKTTE